MGLAEDLVVISWKLDDDYQKALLLVSLSFNINRIYIEVHGYRVNVGISTQLME